MKVALVTTRHHAQDDRIYFKEALSLAKKYKVTLIAPDDRDELEWKNNVKYHPIPRRRKMVGRIFNVFESILAVIKENPDVCHVHDLDLALAIPVLKLVLRKKVIYDSHEVFTKDDLMLRDGIPKSIRPVFATILAKIEKMLLYSCDYIITAFDTDERADFPPNKPITTIFNYPRFGNFYADKKKLRIMLTKYNNIPAVLYLGNLTPDRGLFTMLDAVSIIKKQEHRILLRLVGINDENIKAMTIARAKELEISRNIEITDWLPYKEVVYVIESSLIGLLPFERHEKYERFLPIKMFEYMICELPIVAADLGLIRRYITRSKAGLIYEPSNPEELAECIMELINDPEKRKEMGKNGRSAIEKWWNWNKMEKRLWDVYSDLMSS